MPKLKHFSNTEFEDILIYFSGSILGKNTEEEIAWDLAQNCISRLGFVDCVVYFADAARNVLIQKAAFGPKNLGNFNIKSPLVIPIGKGITGNVALTGTALLITDTTKDPRYIADDDVRLSELCVPIIVDEKIFGVIDCEHPQKHFFKRQHLKILTAIASICAVKIKNVRTERQALQKQNALLDARAELFNSKLKVLRAQMNPHFLFNTINSIQYFITSNNKKLTLSYLSTFGKLLRQYIASFENESVSIESELELLNGYIKLQKLRYSPKIDYSLITKLSETQKQQHIPTMVLCTVLEYITENTLKGNNKNNKVEMQMDLKNEKLRFVTTFEDALEMHGQSKTFLLMKKLLKIWSRLYNVKINFINKINPGRIEQKPMVTLSVTMPIM